MNPQVSSVCLHPELFVVVVRPEETATPLAKQHWTSCLLQDERPDQYGGAIQPASTGRHGPRAFRPDPLLPLALSYACALVGVIIPEVVQSEWYPEPLEDQRVAIVRSEDTRTGRHQLSAEPSRHRRKPNRAATGESRTPPASVSGRAWRSRQRGC
ncbi:hypothetical protein EYF80_055146 [Liparis tanakae]|uniref:Uncharacterized protein n=1 Tax=Liparis tanakae TaxID=230148 RepID=A0A4Z2F0M5_9TELE|nr:hypothetical protein EYF80_055146 [Liparis tanakae]